MKTFYNIGMDNIKQKQITFIVISLIILSINLFFFWIDKSVSTFLLTIIVFCFLFIFNFLGSYICRITLLGNSFSIESLFWKNKHISLSEFKKITVIFPYASVYKINFKNGQKFYFAINSKEVFKTIFSVNHNEYALKLTEEIKKRMQD